MSYRFKVLKFYLASNPFGFAAGEAAVSSTPISIQTWPKFQGFRPTFRDKVILLHVHDILYSLVFISD